MKMCIKSKVQKPHRNPLPTQRKDEKETGSNVENSGKPLVFFRIVSDFFFSLFIFSGLCKFFTLSLFYDKIFIKEKAP